MSGSISICDSVSVSLCLSLSVSLCVHVTCVCHSVCLPLSRSLLFLLSIVFSSCFAFLSLFCLRLFIVWFLYVLSVSLLTLLVLESYGRPSPCLCLAGSLCLCLCLFVCLSFLPLSLFFSPSNPSVRLCLLLFLGFSASLALSHANVKASLAISSSKILPRSTCVINLVRNHHANLHAAVEGTIHKWTYKGKCTC